MITQGKWLIEPTKPATPMFPTHVIWIRAGQCKEDETKPRCWIGITDYTEKPEAEANAQLIAAAPDLLEACKGLMENADDGSARFDDPAPDSIFVKAKQAIEKAERR